MGAGHSANGDSLELAVQFARFHGTEAAGMTMVYDPSFQAWRHFRVSSQPWTVVLDASGNQLFNQPGRVDFSSLTNLLPQ